MGAEWRARAIRVMATPPFSGNAAEFPPECVRVCARECIQGLEGDEMAEGSVFDKCTNTRDLKQVLGIMWKNGSGVGIYTRSPNCGIKLALKRYSHRSSAN